MQHIALFILATVPFLIAGLLVCRSTKPFNRRNCHENTQLHSKHSPLVLYSDHDASLAVIRMRHWRAQRRDLNNDLETLKRRQLGLKSRNKGDLENLADALRNFFTTLLRLK